MKNICLIGDSHTASLRHGWALVRQDFPEIEFTFFAAHRRYMGDLAVEDARLVPLSEDLRLRLNRGKPEAAIAADYDRYLLCGMDYSLYQVMNKLMRFRSEDQAPDNRAPVSDTCYRLAMTGCLRDTVSMRVARKLRAITARPMTIVPGPRISDATELKLYPKLEETGDAERIAGCFAAASEILCREVDAGIVAQPPETLRDPLRTLAVYAKDAPREFDELPRSEGWKDYQHMNAEYGALVLRALFAMPGF